MHKFAIPADPWRRREWIIGELKLRGATLASIARELGRKPQAAANALTVPSAPFEQAFADKLCLPVQALFPERYDADGTRLRRTRPPPVCEAA